MELERRYGERQPTSIKMTASHGNLVSVFRAVELSVSGVMVDASTCPAALAAGALLRLCVELPGHRVPVRALARALPRHGAHQALKFVWLSEVDRLSLAEHVDACANRRLGVA